MDTEGSHTTEVRAIAVVGRSGSGKTTLIEALVPNLRKRGFVVGILKHHHREELFDVPGKDTHRFATSGADVIVGISPLQTAIFTPRSGGYDLREAIDEHLRDVDLVLIEGYARGSFPKIEVHRSERSSTLLCEPDDLWMIVSDRSWDVGVPQFRPSEVDAIASAIVARAR